MKNQYKWKIESFAKGIDANKAIKEFERIKNEFGALTPENMVKASKPKKALLHYIIFKMGDKEADSQYRLQIARVTINKIEVTIISDSEPRDIPVFEIVIVEDKGRQYKHIETLTYNEIEQVKNTTLAMLKQLSHKLKIYKEFNKVLDCLDKAVELLQTKNK